MRFLVIKIKFVCVWQAHLKLSFHNGSHHIKSLLSSIYFILLVQYMLIFLFTRPNCQAGDGDYLTVKCPQCLPALPWAVQTAGGYIRHSDFLFSCSDQTNSVPGLSINWIISLAFIWQSFKSRSNCIVWFSLKFTSSVIELNKFNQFCSSLQFNSK